MRVYGTIAPTFWTGKTGKELRDDPPEVKLIAVYLMTCPHSNMLGLYYLPLPALSHETGCPIEAASKALRRLEEVGFAFYDGEAEWVWIPEMARYQIAPSLKKEDNKVKGIYKMYKLLPPNPFAQQFYDRYKEAFHLPGPWDGEAP